MFHRSFAASLALALVASSTVALARRAPVDEMPVDPRMRRIVAVPPPVFVSSNLSENRFDGMPLDTAQVVVFYDGLPSARPTLQLQCRRGRQVHSLTMGSLPRSSQNGEGRISTAEFRMNGCVPTGLVDVSGVVPDGVIDGVAFGMLYRDRAGRFHQLRSQSADNPRSTAVGMWPLQMSDAHFAANTPQITSGIARAQARTVLFGAEYLGNGRHQLSLPASWASVTSPHTRR